MIISHPSANRLSRCQQMDLTYHIKYIYGFDMQEAQKSTTEIDKSQVWTLKFVLNSANYNSCI